MSGENTFGPTPSPVVVAFYTTGDPRPSKLPANAPAAAILSNSDRFRLRAESLATQGYAYGVASTAAATSTIQALPANLPIAKVYFVGHGFQDGYFFHGHPDPKKDFAGEFSDVLMNPTTQPAGPATATFIAALTKHFTGTAQVEVGFLSCFSGTNDFITSTAQAIFDKGIRNFVVGGFINDYQTTYGYDQQTGKVDRNSSNDSILDKRDKKTVLATGNGSQHPQYEVSSSGRDPNDPLSGILP